jgi:hypothetical protein
LFRFHSSLLVDLGAAGLPRALDAKRLPTNISAAPRHIEASRLPLFGLHTRAAKLSKVLIEGRDRYVLSHGGGGDQAGDEVNLRSLVAAQSVQVTVNSSISTPGLEIKPPSAEAIASRGWRMDGRFVGLLEKEW